MKPIKRNIKSVNIPPRWIVVIIFLFFNLLIVCGMLFLKISWISKFALDIIIIILAKDGLKKMVFKSPIASLTIENK